MKTSSIASLVAFGLLTSLIACSMPAEESAAAATESSIRAMQEDEKLGEMAYSDTREVDLTPSPKYRAISFNAEKGDMISATVTALDGTDPVLWLTDDSFTTLSVNNDVRPTDLSSAISRTLQKPGKYWLVFREMNSAPKAKFSVALKKTGQLPVECDPDGEGFSDPACADPLEADPFDPGSCAGEPLSTADATTKFGAAGGFAMAEAKIYYRTRQCDTESGQAVCSDWVRAFLMDIPIVKAALPNATAPNQFQFTSTSSRAKVKIDFSTEPSALRQFCIDGPFQALRNDAWVKFEDGTPGICSIRTATPPSVGANCARFEPEVIQVGAPDTTRYTEYAAVLHARY